MIIQERDREILRACCDHQFLKLEQVSTYFFGGSFKLASRRVILLREAGYLRTETLPQIPTVRLVRVTKSGRQMAELNRGLTVAQSNRVSFSTYLHDSIVTDVRFRLKRFWDGVWIPERALKSTEYPQIPDGVILFESGKIIAVELENSSKGKARYLKLWNRWTGTGVSLVLYVSTSPRIGAVLKNYLPLAPKGVAFGHCDWDALKLGQPRIWSTQGELDLLSRRTF